MSLYSKTNSLLTYDSTKLQNVRFISVNFLERFNDTYLFPKFIKTWILINTHSNVFSHWVHHTCSRMMIFWVRIESASWVDKASFYLVQCPHQPHSLHQLAAFLLGKCEHHETDVLLSSNCINTKVDQLMSLHRGVSRHWSTVMYRNIKKESLG